MGFKQIMLERMGPKVEVPGAILEYLDWIDANDLGRSYQSGQVYGLSDPASENQCVGLVPPDPDQGRLWLNSDDPGVGERLVPFCQTGGDGSYAAFWVDDGGTTRIVHLGSGSGSTMVGIFVDDPVDLLRLLAIGYEELCWPESHGLTPQELFEEEYPAEDYEGMESQRPPAPKKPEALRKWINERFGVSIPERASDIVSNVPDMMDEASDDPFVTWMNQVRS